MAAKQDLTINERIKSGYLHYVKKIEQHDIATAFEVNGGRVNEACLAILIAATFPKEVRKLCKSLESKMGSK